MQGLLFCYVMLSAGKPGKHIRCYVVDNQIRSVVT